MVDTVCDRICADAPDYTWPVQPPVVGPIAEAAPYAAANAVATFTAATGAGSTAAGLASVTVTNTGAADGTVQGGALSAGASVTFTAYDDPVARQFKRVPAIAYDGTGTTLEIATLS